MDVELPNVPVRGWSLDVILVNAFFSEDRLEVCLSSRTFQSTKSVTPLNNAYMPTQPYDKEQDSIPNKYFSHVSTQHISDGEKTTSSNNKVPLWDLLRSPIFTEHIFMGHFKPQAIQSAHLQPFLWFGYVDDTFVIYDHAAERNLRSASNTSTSSTRACSSPRRLHKTTLSPSLMFESRRKVNVLLPAFKSSGSILMHHQILSPVLPPHIHPPVSPQRNHPMSTPTQWSRPSSTQTQSRYLSPHHH